MNKGHLFAKLTKIRLEASTIYQLRCPECSRTKGLLKISGEGYLKFNDFKKFVDNYPNFKKIELSNYGEIFLNSELEDIIRYACIKNISLTAESGVNLNIVSEEMLERLVKYKFKAMGISITGVTNDTYKIYQRGGNFDKVIKNIRKINYYKQKYKTGLPELKWKFIIFGHNEHELPIARRMAEELNMKFRLKFNFSPLYSPIKNKEMVRKEMIREKGVSAASREEYEKITNKPYRTPCGPLWISPQINWDGRLLGCCVNKWGDFGNVFELGLERCLESEKYIYAKKMILGENKERKDIPCFHCPKYRYQLLKGYNRFYKKYDLIGKNHLLYAISTMLGSIRSIIKSILKKL